MKVKLYQCGGELNKSDSEYPLGLAYIRSNAPPGHDIGIVDSPAQLNECDLVGLSSAAWGLSEAIDILDRSKIPVIIGGQGTLWEPLAGYPFRHIVKGEGETAFNRILSGETLPKIIEEPNIGDIDTIKFPDRGAVRKGVVPILTSRGCPFKCKFCSSRNYWKRARFHSAEYVLDELDYLLARYPIAKQVYFIDDLFIADKSRFEAIYNGWMDRKYSKRVSAKGFVRANLFDEDTGRKLKDMGFNTIRFGAESGSQRILDMLGKGITVKQIEDVAAACRKLGLVCTASFMYNIPGETPADVKATEDLISRTGILKGGWYEFKSFPGCDMYDGESPVETCMMVRPA